ncbi:MAG: FAA hydrolase family protein, partial [Acidimicrobiales bacterium]|nr:FAA hydrolase family protein [Acidimicrobiales bacterium]
MSFRLANVDGRAALVRDDAWFDLERLGTGAPADPMEALANLDALHAADATLGDATPSGSFADALDAGRVGPPVPAPSACFGIGLNYRSHVAESNMAVPTVPVVFTKFPGCLVGPRATVELVGAMCDYEVEL